MVIGTCKLLIRDLAVKRQKEVESGRTAKLLDPANPKVHLDTVQKRPPR
jgi:hypothetical protein